MTCRIVILDAATVLPDKDARRPRFAHEWVAYAQTSASEVRQRIADADIVITNKVQIDAEALAAAKRLRLIAIAATGMDVVDLAACQAVGVEVRNVRDYAARSVPEHTFALILALRRSILPYHRSVEAGRWNGAGNFCYFDYPIRDLFGATLAIVGAGSLGKRVADIGKVFGMNVLFAGRKGEKQCNEPHTPFSEVLERAEIISLHCPLSPATKGMIGKNEFETMRKRPILINTARGGVVDEVGLCDALEDGRISGAGVDVASTEPLPETHPFRRLMGRNDFIVTPHVAWASMEARGALWAQVLEETLNKSRSFGS